MTWAALLAFFPALSTLFGAYGGDAKGCTQLPPAAPKVSGVAGEHIGALEVSGKGLP
jgi:hypothetical protein